MKELEKNIIRLNSLSVGYTGRNHVNVLLEDINAKAGQGELVALLGANGTGKSTLLKTIAGIQSKLGGEISIMSKELEKYSNIDLARQIGFVFAGGINIYNLSVFELVALGRYPHTNWLGRIKSTDREFIDKAIDNVSLTKHYYSRIGQLSDGEKQRAMIARTLAQDTEIIILDEPTAFLDLPNRYDLMYLLKDIAHNEGRTVILSSHDLQIAIREADKLWITFGKRLLEGAPEDMAIDGVINNMFGESPVTFNSSEGQFVYPVRTKMNILLKGEGEAAYWTERALNRLGIKCNPDSRSPFIEIRKDKGDCKWEYCSSVVNKEFTSIYELILYMKEILGPD